MTQTPTPIPPGVPQDPELRERYLLDAERARQDKRSESARMAAEVPPSRTPSGPIWVVAALVSLVLVVGTGAALAGPMLRQSEATERPLPVALSRVEVGNGTGDVRVRVAEPGERPAVTSTVEWGLRRPTTRIDVSGSTAALHGECPNGFITVCSTDWLVVVPAGTAIDISQGLGGVTVEGPRGELDIEAGVGDIEITEAQSQQIDVRTGVGSVRIESVEPPQVLQASVGVGDLTARLPGTATYDMDTDVGTGEVSNTLGSTPGADHRAHLEVGVGEMNVAGS
ncbi:hypothetical protein [Janibacter alittae]|uniref:Adhesin domain-containing protein n=1 Tax=Janibacter alittae TaxID=3115209 RepID=A0ABZ2MHX7_9MICO